MVDSTVALLSAAGALDGTELFYLVQGGADKKLTSAAARAVATKAPTLTAQAYTTLAGDLMKWLAVTSGASDATITLLSAATAGDGAYQWISKADAGAGKVIVSDGATRANLYVQNDMVVLRSDGAVWTPVLWNIKPVKQVFTVSGTWTKDPLAKSVRVLGFGQGGGGSSGQRRAASAIRAGGGPGGPGAVVDMRFNAATLGATETVTIPTDATGGAAQTVNDTASIAGTQGSPTTFGSWLSAVAGLPGAVAALGSSNSGGGSQLTQNNIGIPNQGTASATTTSTPALASDGQVAAGGPGAGATAANVLAPTTAAPSGSCYSGTKTTGGTIASAGNPGGNGADVSDTDKQMGGGGGAGGWWATSTAGTAGGNGGAPGGGSGGGGASDNGTNSGAGGTPGRGEVRVWQFFG